MKVIGGIYKGFRLQSLPGNEIRPTPNRIREALFDIIGAKIVGAEFLDLFSGSGAVGIEAISRGAKNVTFVEKNKKAIILIKNNLIKIYQNDFSKIIHIDYLQAINILNFKQKKFDIIFLDPPYNRNYALNTLHIVDQNNIAKEDCIIIVQHPFHKEVKGDFRKLLYIKEKKYGKSKVTLFYYQ
jgi:16S rRNA (guanine966-N2)-methyltransferase